jgi:hypothetical protein
MDARRHRAAISEALRRSIVESRVSYSTLERKTGVTRASILGFVRGDQSLRLGKAGRLAEFFELELRTRA